MTELTASIVWRSVA